jgi:hypothetical protein
MRPVHSSPPIHRELADPVVVTARTAAPDTHTRTCFRLVLLSIGIGVVLRVVQYLHHTSYWNDEAALVLNILQRDYRDLLRPLDFAQAAPPLFLWAERWVALHFGSSEYALRALPVLIGLATLPLFATLAWRLLRPAGAAWAVAWLSINHRIVPQVCEVKQYAADLFFSTLLLLVAFAPRRPASPLRRLARAAVVASVAFWFSFPSAIVFGGIALALLPRAVRGGRSGLPLSLASLLAPLASAALLAKLVLGNPRDRYLDEFWANYFVNFARPLHWFAHAFFELGDYPFASLGVVVLLLAVIGLFALRSQGRAAFVGAVLATLLLAIVASALRVYPFGGLRVTLYLLPPLFLLMGAGAQPWQTIAPSDGRNFRVAWLILPAPLLLLAIANSAKHSVDPEARSNIRPVVRYVRQHRRGDEAIFLAGGGVLPQTRVSGRNVEFLCYWPLGDERNIFRQMIPPEQITADQLPSRRFWVVFSLISTEKLSLRDPLLHRLQAVADPQTRFAAGPAVAILYQLRDGDGDGGGPPATTHPAATKSSR